MICPHCQKTIEDWARDPLQIDLSKPGLGGLLQGEGSDPLLNALAWCGALGAVFAAAIVCFWALGTLA